MKVRVNKFTLSKTNFKKGSFHLSFHVLELFKDFLSGSVTEKHYKAMLYSFIIFYKAILLLEIIHYTPCSLPSSKCWLLEVMTRMVLMLSSYLFRFCLLPPWLSCQVLTQLSQHIFSSLTPLPLSFFVIPLKSHYYWHYLHFLKYIFVFSHSHHQ